VSVERRRVTSALDVRQSPTRTIVYRLQSLWTSSSALDVQLSRLDCFPADVQRVPNDDNDISFEVWLTKLNTVLIGRTDTGTVQFIFIYDINFAGSYLYDLHSVAYIHITRTILRTKKEYNATPACRHNVQHQDYIHQFRSCDLDT